MLFQAPRLLRYLDDNISSAIYVNVTGNPNANISQLAAPLYTRLIILHQIVILE